MGVAELRFNAALLFGGAIPRNKETEEKVYSFGWGGAAIGEHTVQTLRYLFESKSIPEFRKSIDDMTEKEGYRGVAANMILADNSNNIAY